MIVVNGNLGLGTGGLLDFNGTLTPGNYPLIDYSGSLTGSSGSTWTVQNHQNDGNIYSFNVSNDTGPGGMNQFDLTVVGTSSTYTWNSNSSSTAWNSSGNWNPATVPSQAGLTIVFGTGSQGNVTLGGSSFTMGSLVFNNAAPGYTVGSDGSGTLVLDNNGTGATVQVSNGAGPYIYCALTLADAQKVTTFSIDGSSGSMLTVSGAIGGSGQAIVLNGGGTLELDGNNTYSGGTTVNSGILNVAAGADINSGMQDGNLGTGPLTINAQGTTNSTVNLGAGMTIYTLSGTVGSSGGMATLNVGNSAVTLVQSAVGNFGGTVNIGSGGSLSVQGGSPLSIGGPVNVGTSLGGTGALTMAGTSTLTLSGATTFYNNSSLTVSSGTLTVSGPTTFGSNSGSTNAVSVNGGTLVLSNSTSNPTTPNIINGTVTVAIAQSATLQLAGNASALSNANGTSAANITTVGSGASSDGAVVVSGTTTQTVGVISSTPMTSGGATTYAGNTTVGDGTNVASLTATQILQNSLTINAGSTVTIAPSDPASSGAVAASSVAGGSSATAAVAADSADVSSDPFTAIQAAIASGAISSATGQVLENRIAAIERLAATDPGLDASLLESRVLAVLPSGSVVPAIDPAATDPAATTDGTSNLLAMDSSSLGATSTSATGAAFAPAASFAASPAAVPEPSSLLLAALAGIGLIVAARRRTIGCK